MKKILISILRTSLLAVAIIGAAVVMPEVHLRWLQAKAHNSTKQLFTLDMSRGTGFYVNTPKGREVIMTAGHMCEGTQVYTLESVGTLKKLFRSSKDDLCVAEVPEVTLKHQTFELASSDASWGEKIFTFGYPLGEGPYFRDGRVGKLVTSLVPMRMETIERGCDKKLGELSVTVPFVGAACARVYRSIASTVNGYPGNSGGPVFTTAGKIIGVIVLGDGRTNTLLYTPLDRVRAALERVDEYYDRKEAEAK